MTLEVLKPKVHTSQKIQFHSVQALCTFCGIQALCTSPVLALCLCTEQVTKVTQGLYIEQEW